MASRTQRCLVVGTILAGGFAAGSRVSFSDNPTKKTTPDQQFEVLYSSAMKTPEKADWKQLRRAFAETTHYGPYDITVDETLRKLSARIEKGQFKDCEGELLKLLERERHMRIHTLVMAMDLYEKMQQPEKVQKYKKLADRIWKILLDKETGASFDKPIEVVYIGEEYLVVKGKRVKKQALQSHEGHKFDVLTVVASGGEPEREYFFNIDLPDKALSRMFK
jgi:hypothetical protein